MFQEEGSSSSTSSSPLQYFSLMALSSGLRSPYPWLRELKPEERGLCLIHLLLTCANHVASGSIENANITLEQISCLAGPDGDTMQRIAAYFSEALADRVLKSWPGLHKALNSTKISNISEEILAQRLFYDVCPFLKLSYLVTNQAIIEAMEGEKMVHIIDLGSFEPAQWISLLQALSIRPEGPPHLRITGVHERKEVLDQMAARLMKEAEKLDIPFQFNPIVSGLEDLDVESLRVKTGEALAVSLVSRLHSLLAFDDETPRRNPKRAKSGDSLDKERSPEQTSLSPQTSPKVGPFLRTISGLSPKIMVVTEQESDLNGCSLMERVIESLNFYAALFDSLELTMPRGSTERKKLEKMLFGDEIKNIVACEGTERRVRHEKLEKWVQRIEGAGFAHAPLSYQGLLLATRFLHTNNFDGYKIKEDNGFMFLCWQDRPLYSVSAWKFRRYN